MAHVAHILNNYQLGLCRCAFGMLTIGQLPDFLSNRLIGFVGDAVASCFIDSFYFDLGIYGVKGLIIFDFDIIKRLVNKILV